MNLCEVKTITTAPSQNAIHHGHDGSVNKKGSLSSVDTQKQSRFLCATVGRPLDSFRHCGSLQGVLLNNWSIPRGQSSTHIMRGCRAEM